jgi:hypothetical protein
MATYAKADNNREAWIYETDVPATTFRVSSKTVYTSDGTDGAKYGGSQADGSEDYLPAGFKMRAAKCKSAAGAVRWIVCYDTACDLWTTLGTTVTRDINGVDTVMTRVKGVRSERWPRRLAGITQTA